MLKEKIYLGDIKEGIKCFSLENHCVIELPGNKNIFYVTPYDSNIEIELGNVNKHVSGLLNGISKVKVRAGDVEGSYFVA